jgi:HD-like signal output (HDOD) protein
MTHYASLIDLSDSLLTFPSVASKLNRIIDDPRTSMKVVADLIHSDVALATRTLRLANSPIFGASGKVSTISRAVELIGLSNVRQLVMSAAVSIMFEGIPYSVLNVEDLLFSGMICGQVARELAIASNINQADEFFTAGLLHRVGSMLLALAYPDDYFTLMLETISSPHELAELERDTFGVDHADLGADLMAYWNFPLATQQMVAGYLNPDPRSLGFREASLLLVAVSLVWSCYDANGNAVGERSESIKNEHLEIIGLTSEQAEEALDKARIGISPLLVQSLAA